MNSQTKQVKLHGKYRSRTKRPGRSAPWLNVNGLWLEEAGFCIGQAIEIKVEDKQLIIKAL